MTLIRLQVNPHRRLRYPQPQQPPQDIPLVDLISRPCNCHLTRIPLSVWRSIHTVVIHLTHLFQHTLTLHHHHEISSPTPGRSSGHDGSLHKREATRAFLRRREGARGHKSRRYLHLVRPLNPVPPCRRRCSLNLLRFTETRMKARLYYPLFPSLGAHLSPISQRPTDKPMRTPPHPTSPTRGQNPHSAESAWTSQRSPFQRSSSSRGACSNA